MVMKAAAMMMTIAIRGGVKRTGGFDGGCGCGCGDGDGDGVVIMMCVCF